MAVYCDYCHKEKSEKDACPHCGKVVYSAGGRIIYGATVKDISACEVTITDKYLIIRKVSKAEATGARLGNSGGLIGAVIVDAARNSISRPHGFYALSNIRKGIFPYRTNGIRRNNAIKLINKDGTDFILIFDKPGFWDSATKVMKKMVGYIKAAIPEVENGSGKNYGAVHCSNPYVTFDNLDKITSNYVAKSVATENIKVSDGVQPKVEQPETVNQTKKVRPTPIITPPPSNFVTDANVSPTKVRCVKCGNYVFADRNFCNKCGTKIVHEVRCSRCSRILEEEDSYCSYCGQKVDL